MCYLLHLHIEGTLLHHEGIIDKPEGIHLMVSYLGSSLVATNNEVTVTRGGHARFTYLRTLMRSHLQHARQFQRAGDIASLLLYLDWAVRVYLLFVFGTTIFSNKVKNYVDLTYLLYLRDLELVSMFA
jgi:hypothetical protein